MKAKFLALALLAACGGPAGPVVVVPPPSDLDVLMQRVDTGALIFGGSRESLNGWTIRIEDGPFECGNTESDGCTESDGSQIRINPNYGMPHCRYMVMIHEMGHVILYERTGDIDPHHKDPRWRTVDNAIMVCRNLD